MRKITKVTLSMLLIYGISGTSIPEYSEHNDDDNSRIRSGNKDKSEYENKDKSEYENLINKVIRKVAQYTEDLNKASKENDHIKVCLNNYYSAIDNKIRDTNIVLTYFTNVTNFALKEDLKQNLFHNEFINFLHKLIEFICNSNPINYKDHLIADLIVRYTSDFKDSPSDLLPFLNLILDGHQLFEQYLSSKNSLSKSKKDLDKALENANLSDLINLDKELDKDFNNLAFLIKNGDLFFIEEIKENIEEIKEILRMKYLLNFGVRRKEEFSEYNPAECEEEKKKYEERLKIVEDAKKKYLKAIQQNAENSRD